jgi:hypothetical protein
LSIFLILINLCIKTPKVSHFLSPISWVLFFSIGNIFLIEFYNISQLFNLTERNSFWLSIKALLDIVQSHFQNQFENIYLLVQLRIYVQDLIYFLKRQIVFFHIIVHLGLLKQYQYRLVFKLFVYEWWWLRTVVQKTIFILFYKQFVIWVLNYNFYRFMFFQNNLTFIYAFLSWVNFSQIFINFSHLQPNFDNILITLKIILL